jgi:UDP-N-acetylglucosamine 2-epimerase
MIVSTVLAAATSGTLEEKIRHLSNPFGDGHASTAIAKILQKTPRR